MYEISKACMYLFLCMCAFVCVYMCVSMCVYVYTHIYEAVYTGLPIHGNVIWTAAVRPRV